MTRPNPKRGARKWKSLVDTKYFDPNADLKKPIVHRKAPRKPRDVKIGTVYWTALDGSGLEKAVKMHHWLTRYIAWAKHQRRKSK